MAVIRKVQSAINKEFPGMDIRIRRGHGYYYFTGVNGESVVESIMANPASTSTEDLIAMAIDEIRAAHEG